MALRRRRRDDVFWVVSVPEHHDPSKRHFLRSTRGGAGDDGWGPSVTSTEDVFEAIRHSSQAEALRGAELKTWSRESSGVRAHRVALSEIVAYDD